jgi:hypothetical protein
VEARNRSSSALADEKHKSECGEVTKDFMIRIAQLEEESSSFPPQARS